MHRLVVIVNTGSLEFQSGNGHAKTVKNVGICLQVSWHSKYLKIQRNPHAIIFIYNLLLSNLASLTPSSLLFSSFSPLSPFPFFPQILASKLAEAARGHIWPLFEQQKKQTKRRPNGKETVNSESRFHFTLIWMTHKEMFLKENWLEEFESNSAIINLVQTKSIVWQKSTEHQSTGKLCAYAKDFQKF